MKILFSERAWRDYKNLPLRLRKAADKQLDFLLRDLKHPSLRAKKYDEARDIWQARLSKDWRLYFKVRSEAYVIITIIKHPK